MINHKIAWLPVFVLMVTLVIACLSFSLLRDKEEAGFIESFNLSAQHRFEAIEAIFLESLNILESLQSFHKASEFISRDEFGSVSKVILEKHSFVKALAWVPLVNHTERHTFEQNARREGVEDFQFSVRDGETSLHRSPVKETYFPAYYVEPYSGNELMVGLDLASDSKWLAAIKIAQRTGGSIATPPIQFYPGNAAQRVFLLFTPVYKKNAITFIPKGREDGLLGILLGIINVDDLIETATANMVDRRTLLYLFDTTNGANASLLFHGAHSSDNSPYLKIEEDMRIDTDNFLSSLGFDKYYWKGDFTFTNRNLTIVSVAKDDMIDDYRTMQPVIVAIFCIFIGSVIAFLFWNQMQRSLLIEKKVNARTEALKRAMEKVQNAERSLRASEEKARSILNVSRAAIVLLDRSGTVLDCNDVFLRRFGKMRDQLIGTCVWDFSDEKRVELLKIQITNTFETGESSIVEDERDGVWNEHRIKVVNRTEKGEVGSVVVKIFDITERKRAEDRLRESEEKLARSKKMESIGLLAGGVAHDLNNVLAGIVSYPELVLMSLPENSKLRKPLETIQAAGQRAAAIVQDLLTVARGVAITKEPLCLNDIIKDYLMSPEFQKLNLNHPAVQIITDLDNDLLNIRGSFVHIRKVVMNLVSNASEAIVNSGKVVISTMNQYVDRPLKGYEDINIGEYAVLAVTDDGTGISPDDLGRIFEPFFTKKVLGRSGTGLGLAVVWNTVQDHEGYIDVVHDENGTRFKLYFPITRDEIPEKALPKSTKDYRGNGETILVVDDMDTQREVSCKMLDVLGYNTVAVSSGEEAIAFIKENSVDLILLDMIMDPGLNGRETYKRIIEIRPDQKAIIASGFAETDEVKKTIELGAGRYLKKPFTLEKVGIAVKKELAK